jgi:hypothetical protein
MSEGKLKQEIKAKAFHCWDSETKEEYEQHNKDIGDTRTLEEVDMSVNYEDLKAVLDTAISNFPKLEPIIIAEFPKMPDPVADITSDFVNCYLSRMHFEADIQRQIEEKTVKYIKAVAAWRKKWLGKDI